MTTIREIAAACNVSIATVSNILNGNGKRKASERTQKLVLEKARELNYTPNLVAKNLRLQRTKTLGILIEDMTVFHVPYVVDGITEYCENTGYGQTHVDLRLCSKLGNDYFRILHSPYRMRFQNLPLNRWTACSISLPMSGF